MANVLRSLQGDRPHEWDAHLEAMLSGQDLSENVNVELQGVGELLAALRAAPMDPVEGWGQVGALEAFRETFATSQPLAQRRRRPAMPSAFLRAKLAVALAAGAVSLGGVAAAAYTGSLPAGLQDLAHTTLGAPAAHEGESGDDPNTADQGEAPDHAKAADPGESARDGRSTDQGKAPESTKGTAVGPDATGHAAFGLCTAWQHVQANGNPADRSVAFRNLETAAGGLSTITAYCAKVPHPGTSGTGSSSTHPTGSSSTHPTGSSSTHPTGSSSTHPTGSSSTHPTGSSSTHPTGSSSTTGKPATHPDISTMGKPAAHVSGQTNSHPTVSPAKESR